MFVELSLIYRKKKLLKSNTSQHIAFFLAALRKDLFPSVFRHCHQLQSPLPLTQVGLFFPFLSAVPTADGEADDGVLGSQSCLPAHSPAGQENTCQNVRIAGH